MAVAGEEHPAAPHPDTRRTAARVVLVDAVPAVLLISGRDPSLPGAEEFWFTPGGGTERGETLEQAARREVHEEMGHVLDELGPVVWQRTTAFEFDGRPFAQEESYFVVRTERFDARRVAWTEIESRSMTGWRWWPVAELSTTDAAVYPQGLGVLVEEWLRDGPPDRPRLLG